MASVQAVALTADENNLGIPGLDALLASLDTITLGEVLGFAALTGDETILGLLNPLLGPLADVDLNTLLAQLDTYLTLLPDLGLGDLSPTEIALDVLGFFGVDGDQTIPDALLTILGLGEDATILDGLGLFSGIADLDADVLLLDYVGSVDLDGFLAGVDWDLEGLLEYISDFGSLLGL